MDNNEILEVNEDNSLTSTLCFQDLIKEELEKENNNKNNKEMKPERNYKKVIIIISIIIGSLLLLGIIGYVIIKVFNKEEKDNENNNVIEEVIIEKENYKYVNGSLVFLNSNDKEIGTYECTNKDDTKCYIVKNDLSKDGTDRNKSYYENGDELISNIKIIDNTYAVIQDGDNMFIYNISNNEKILDIKNAKTYDTVNNYVIIEDDKNRYGVIELKDNELSYVIRPSYDDLSMINSTKGILLAKDKDKKYLINIEEEKLNKNIDYDVKNANDLFVVGLKDDKYNLYNYDNEILLNGYEYITLFENLIVLVKDRRLYLMDKELNKYNEEGIRLDNTYYNKEYIYNSKNRLINTNKSFDINNKEDVIEITSGNTTTSINKYEMIANKELSYINYLSGKLYFYKDIEKTNLIGSYECKNDNKLDKDKNNLLNCNIYNTLDGTTSIYNNEYVFIKDYDDSNNGLIYLYSLKDNKVKGTYDDFDENINYLEPEVKVSYTANSYFVVRTAVGNNKGKYGVIMITDKGVEGKIPFEYSKIMKNKDNYILEKDSNYTIVDKNFDILYNYVNKTSNYYLFKDSNDMYYVFNKDMDIISNSFNFIELYDNYYVGINENKLNLYKYDRIKVLNRDLDVEENKFQVSYNDGYIIKINDNEYRFDENGKYIEEEGEE